MILVKVVLSVVLDLFPGRLKLLQWEVDVMVDCVNRGRLSWLCVLCCRSRASLLSWVTTCDLVAEQQADSSLKGLMEQVRSESEVQDGACGYFLQDSLLAPPTSPGCLMVFGFLCSYGTQHLTSTHFHSCIHAPSPLID
ncbi:uncharacterized protein LOC113745020 isoform X2 [Larimichthys crocea]|uniref:uncharacterized protein LOC113745020 isoform X2 n=1 Tax=Larimichthys crocea TaxID=215358 RepID=UPI000F5F0D0A|nr:uncharacterized protein LOC113745020 isoform X2 [Larimichthys crocea]